MEVNAKKFTVSENEITESGGILFKYSVSVPFIKAQNVVTTANPLMYIFNLERLSAWTSSPSQISIREGQSDNRPDLSLILNKEDAENVKKRILGN